MAGLTLPFSENGSGPFQLFAITCESGGGTGVVGMSFGTDQSPGGGNAGVGVYGKSDVAWGRREQ